MVWSLCLSSAPAWILGPLTCPKGSLAAFTHSSLMHSTFTSYPGHTSMDPLPGWTLAQTLEPRTHCLIQAEVCRHTPGTPELEKTQTHPQQPIPGPWAVTYGPTPIALSSSLASLMLSPQQLVFGTGTIPSPVAGSSRYPLAPVGDMETLLTPAARPGAPTPCSEP